MNESATWLKLIKLKQISLMTDVMLILFLLRQIIWIKATVQWNLSF